MLSDAPASISNRPPSPAEASAAPPRVLLMNDSHWPIVGGGETHAKLMCDTLNAIGVPVRVLTQHRLTDSPTTETLDGVRIDRVGSPGRKRIGKYTMIPAAMRWLREHRDDFDVIYCCGLRVLGVPAVRAGQRLGKPVVLRSESCTEMSGAYIDDHLTGVKAIGKPMAKAAVAARNAKLRKADAFMAISTAVAQEFRDCGVPESKIRLIFNGLDLAAFSQDSATPRDELRRELGLPQDATLLVYTGKLNAGKGLEYLVEAFATIAPQHPEAHLVLVGGGANQALSIEDQLRRQVRDAALDPRVTFTGYTTRVPDYLRACDVFVFPSESEAFGLSLVEAMACGLPAVATDVGGIPDIVTSPALGTLVPPRDATALADAMRGVLNDPEQSAAMAEHGRASVCERFDAEAIARQHLELFTELVEARRTDGGGPR